MYVPIEPLRLDQSIWNSTDCITHMLRHSVIGKITLYSFIILSLLFWDKLNPIKCDVFETDTYLSIVSELCKLEFSYPGMRCQFWSTILQFRQQFIAAILRKWEMSLHLVPRRHGVVIRLARAYSCSCWVWSIFGNSMYTTRLFDGLRLWHTYKLPAMWLATPLSWIHINSIFIVEVYIYFTLCEL